MTTTAKPGSSIEESTVVSAAINARGDLSQRIARMREQVLAAPREISLVRARELTSIVKNNPDMPRPIQLAEMVRETLRKLPISIGDDERLVGAHSEKFKAAILSPETKSNFLIAELDNFDVRETIKFEMSDEEKRELREEILPFWKNNSAFDDMMSRQSEMALFYERMIAIVFQHDIVNDAHLADIQYRKVLEIGIDGIIEEAKTGLAAVSDDDSEAEKKRTFYQSVIISLEAIIEFAGRYSDLALAMADDASSKERERELRGIADIVSRAPAKPARTFYEALQSLFFTFLGILQLDNSGEVPLGRIDQYLYPYYKSDIENGKITRDDALELIEEFYIKFNKIMILVEYAITKVHDGNTSRYKLTLGGVGIVLGLATFGYRVMRLVGTKVTEITPSRGVAADLSTMVTVLACSKMGLPVSTTHTLVGAIIGVGLARGITAIDRKIVGSIFVSWLVTVPIAAALTIVFYLIGKWLFW